MTTHTLIQLIEHRLWAGSLLGTGTTTCNRQHPSSREAYALQQANKWTESFQIVKKATPTVKQVMGKCWGWSESRSGGQVKPSWGRGYLSWNSTDEKEPAYKKHVMRTTSKHKGMLGRSGLVWSRTQKEHMLFLRLVVALWDSRGVFPLQLKLGSQPADLGENSRLDF